MNPDPARAPVVSHAAPAEPPRPVPTNDRGTASKDAWDDGTEGDAGGEPAFKPLTREEAQDLRARLPVMSVWSLLTWQAATGAIMVALWGLLSLQADKTWSALFGAVSVVVPNALMAWGMTRQSARDAGTPMLTFAVWELVKIILAVAILVAVAMGFASLSWAALLSTLVVTLKANWLALLRRGRIRK
ncbi:ATP synthase subunit I [Roseateles chitinivorans]|uniref:ATP synthase subunit I n=1 Tax=Roseateles chitinivorans TaxID=2917965 RepID=UPI003D674963